MAGRDFTCELCKGSFVTDDSWSEEDKIKEARENFGYDVPEEERTILCSDCYGKVMEKYREYRKVLPYGGKCLNPNCSMVSVMGSTKPTCDCGWKWNQECPVE